MRPGDQWEGRKQRTIDDITDQLRVHDEEGSATKAGQRGGERPDIVRLDESRLDGEHGVRHPPQLGGTARRTDRSVDGPVENGQAAPVPEPRGQRGEGHDGIHAVLETRYTVDQTRHDTARVEQIDDGLVPLGSIGAKDGPAAALAASALSGIENTAARLRIRAGRIRTTAKPLSITSTTDWGRNGNGRGFAMAPSAPGDGTSTIGVCGGGAGWVAPVPGAAQSGVTASSCNTGTLGQ